jgi:perosamine synthetase
LIAGESEVEPDSPMIDHEIPQMEPLFGEPERLLVDEYLRHPGFITEYRRTAEFEAMIAAFTGAKHCVAVNNGTVSLMAAGLALGLRHGDEIIVPNYTMIASGNAFRALGVAPRFVDVERSTLCLDFEQTKAALRPSVKAILLVNANGRYPSYPIAALERLAADAGVSLIEDAAQGLGSWYPDGVHVGLRGVVGSLSFSAPKIISTGQGGALITNDDEMTAKLRRVKDFGRDCGGLDQHPHFGLNFKFTELQACVGIAQFARLRGRITRKKEIWRRYASNLTGVSGVELFRHDLEYTTPWFIDALIEKRRDLAEFLFSRRVKTRVMYPPLNKQPIYGERISHPISEMVGAHGLWLPSHSHLTDDEVDYVCECIREFCRA